GGEKGGMGWLEITRPRPGAHRRRESRAHGRAARPALPRASTRVRPGLREYAERRGRADPLRQGTVVGDRHLERIQERDDGRLAGGGGRLEVSLDGSGLLAVRNDRRVDRVEGSLPG